MELDWIEGRASIMPNGCVGGACASASAGYLRADCGHRLSSAVVRNTAHRPAEEDANERRLTTALN
jgi:hypothetical protein